MKITLVTDIHHGEDTNYSNVGGPKYVNSFGHAFSESVGSVLSKTMEASDLVMDLGDLITNTQDPEADKRRYAEAMEAFPGKTPEFHVLGNHDSWDISREDWARLVGVPKSYYAFDLGGYRHVVLDSNRVGRSGPGVVPPEQLDWLRRTLGASEFPVVVYSHYPVDDQSMEGNCYFQNRPEKAFVSNREEVRAILENSGKVLAVFSGHTHFGSDREIVGIRYVTVPSFSENDGKNRPSGKFAVATLKDRNVIVEVRKAA